MRLLGLGGLLVLALAAFTPLAAVLTAWMAGPPRLEPAQAIVVLGRGGVDRDGTLSAASLRRTLHGIELYRQGLAPALVLSGGWAEGPAPRGAGPMGEAALRAELARRLGVPDRAVWPAPGGRTTWGEAQQARALLGSRGVHRILLVADAVDMPRTRATFERAGFEVLPAPAGGGDPSGPEGRLALLRDMCTEAAGWTYYWLAGRL